MLRDILFKFNPWWEESFHPGLIERPDYLNVLYRSLKRRSIELITGLRRVGKTAMMKMLIETLLSKIESETILYVSLDAYGLESYSLHDILEEFRKIHKHKRTKFLYLFFDEVITKSSFQQELKNFYDSESVKVFASASQSGLLKDQRAPLTGRSRMHEILPLNFTEYLDFKKIKLKNRKTTYWNNTLLIL